MNRLYEDLAGRLKTRIIQKPATDAHTTEETLSIRGVGNKDRISGTRVKTNLY